MKYTYNLKWLTDKFDNGEPLKFLFFWGHARKANEKVGKFCFSQWFELPFTVEDVVYKTAEHWMMANKALLFADFKSYEKIINCDSPGEAKKLGRYVLGFDEQLWCEKRFDIVVKGNIHKFNQSPEYADFLLNTKDRVLVEASPVDRIWGIGLASDTENIDDPYWWNGENLLGFALMEVRDFIREYSHFTNLENIFSPPWRHYPKIDPHDLFWRMGKGEDIINNFSRYYSSLSKRDQMIFKLTHPAPYDWPEFYGD